MLLHDLETALPLGSFGFECLSHSRAPGYYRLPKAPRGHQGSGLAWEVIFKYTSVIKLLFILWRLSWEAIMSIFHLLVCFFSSTKALVYQSKNNPPHRKTALFVAKQHSLVSIVQKLFEVPIFPFDRE